MANLFASRLVGLEKHYESIVANLEIIQRCAHNITRHEDYKDLPRSLVAFKTEGNDSTSISADFFCLLSQSYAEYHAYADEYFDISTTDLDGVLNLYLNVSENMVVYHNLEYLIGHIDFFHRRIPKTNLLYRKNTPQNIVFGSIEKNINTMPTFL